MLDLSNNAINGSIPATWAQASAFPTLTYLSFNQTKLSGAVPAFHNGQLQMLIGSSCLFDGDLAALWTSSAPFSTLSLADNHISGQLPKNASSLPTLALLNLQNNQLQGSVPLSWLQADMLLSHIMQLNVANIWDSSQRSDWKQALCLKSGLYNYNVDMHAINPIQSILTSFASSREPHPDLIDWTHYVPSAATILAFPSQLESVGHICQNANTASVLLVMWLIFAALVAMIIAAYEGLRYWQKRQEGQPPSNSILSRFARSAFVGYIKKIARFLKEVFSGFIQLALYYYDLISALVVLSRVHHKWPGYILFAIFFFHFALVGGIVVYRAISAGSIVFPRQQRPCGTVSTVLIATCASPFMIPVILVLDTVAFVKEIGIAVFKVAASLLCCGDLARAWLQTHMAAGRLNRTYTKLGWFDIENYERMHNTIAALFQTVPVVVLNSVVFALGNKPTNGLFFSRKLFVSCMVASFLAMLKVLLVVIWHAYFKKQHAFRYAGNVMTGAFIAAPHDRDLNRTPSTQILIRQSNSSSAMDPKSVPLEVPAPARMPKSNIELPKWTVETG